MQNPTRYREQQIPTVDDLIFTSDENTVTTIGYGPHLGKSDHISLTTELQMTQNSTQRKHTIYSYDKADYNKMGEMLNVDWETELTNLSTQDAMDKLENILAKAVEECVPHRTVKGNGASSKPIWMTREALRTVRKKHSSWIRYLNTKDGKHYQ